MSKDTTRRNFLAGAAALLAGCNAPRNGSGESSQETSVPTPQDTVSEINNGSNQIRTEGVSESARNTPRSGSTNEFDPEMIEGVTDGFTDGDKLYLESTLEAFTEFGGEQIDSDYIDARISHARGNLDATRNFIEPSYKEFKKSMLDSLDDDVLDSFEDIYLDVDTGRSNFSIDDEVDNYDFRMGSSWSGGSYEGLVYLPDGAEDIKVETEFGPVRVSYDAENGADHQNGPDNVSVVEENPIGMYEDGALVEVKGLADHRETMRERGTEWSYNNMTDVIPKELDERY